MMKANTPVRGETEQGTLKQRPPLGSRPIRKHDVGINRLRRRGIYIRFEAVAHSEATCERDGECEPGRAIPGLRWREWVIVALARWCLQLDDNVLMNELAMCADFG